jgi:hypothetical protein
VLEFIIGLDTQPKRDKILLNAGCTVVEDLLYVESESLLSCLELDTPILSKTRLKTLKKWAEDTFDVFGTVDIAGFTLDVCKVNQRTMARSSKPSTSTTTDKAVIKDKLRNFNGNRDSWPKGKRELTAHLNQIKNELGIPVYYVIRDMDDEQQYRNDNGDIGRRIYDAPFEGRVYESDAFLVLQILRQWTSGGTADYHVDNTNDVQEAWNNLLRSYEGVDARGANIQKARKQIEEAKWVSNQPNHTFDDYCTKIEKANNELNRYGANVEPESQVLAFLKGIRADGRVNPHLLSIKTTIISNDVLRNNLERAITTFKDTMRQLSNTSSDREQRQISATNQQGGQGGRYNNRGGAGRYHQGGYQQSGHYNYQGRGRRNRNRGYHRGGRNNRGEGRGDGGRRIYLPRQVLDSVEPEYREYMIQGRNAAQREANEKAEQQNQKRTASVAARNDDHMTSNTSIGNSTIRSVQFDEDDTPSPAGASSQFGATGRKNRKLMAMNSTNR